MNFTKNNKDMVDVIIKMSTFGAKAKSDKDFLPT